MSRMGVSRILAEELGRVLGEYRKVDGQWESLATERRRLAGVAQRLSDILRHEAGQKASERLVSEMGLSEMLAALPHLPGRSRSVPAAAEAKAPAPEAPPMAKGSGIRMLAGLYKGWTGTIRWANTKAGKTTYTVSLQGPEGQSARTQVAPRSLGQKWEAAPEITAAPPRTRGPRKAAAAARPAGRTAARLVAPPPPADALPKGTAVRLLTGKFEGWAGVISAISAKGRAITYAVTLRGPDGQRGRTQVNQGSLGRSWQVTDGAAPGAEAAPREPVQPGKIVRRRPPPVVAAPEPAPVGDPNLPPGILPPQTPVKMLVGHFLGFTGTVTSVQARPGPRPDALYSVLLHGPDGRVIRTSVRHSSLGRGWTRVG